MFYSNSYMANYFWIGVNENDETGIDFNSLVDIPAHMKGVIYFSKDTIRYSFNDEKRIVTGVMIAANQPIYRWSKDFGDHYVIFKPETIDLIRRKFFENGFQNNLNIQHDPNQVQNGVTLVDSYIVSNTDPKLPNVPEAFESMQLQDGSWIASYHIKNDELWQKVKEGKFGGFSVEGWFEKIKINTKNKMKKEKKSIWDLFTTKQEPEAQVFSQAVTADGVTVTYDGELVEGTTVYVELEGQQVPAPEGDHELTLEDGTVKVVTLDSNGVITAVADVQQNAADPADPAADPADEMRAEVADAMMKQTAEIHERFKAMEDRFKAIEAENTALKAQLDTISKGDKFGADPKKTASKTASYKDLLTK